jgi:acyl transferase domain-containing protein/NADP-dependent 3-hydroxy acid dehydrogenase YdfG
MSNSAPIAIVGMSSLFAGSNDLLEFWRDIVSATDRLTDVPESAWLIDDYYDPDPSVPDMTYAKRGGFLDPVPFDPMEFGLPPTAVPATDTAQLLALIVAKRALADAGRFHDGEVDHSRTSVILGVASATELVVQMGSRLQHPIWRKALREAGLPESRVQEIIERIKDHYQPWQESTFPGLLGNVVAGRIANRLDLGGSNFVTDAACASSISALQAGLAELYLGDSDMVIAGGVDALNDILMYMCFSKTPAFSPTGDCRPFSEDADGTLIGEGVGMLALRRLEDAEADGDAIYAVIRGLGASSDGRGSSVYAPRPQGQAIALKRAYEKAGYSPATVELVEAHGTATKAGDAAEVRGLTSVFGPTDEDGRQWCALGSVKSQIGHTKAAAGAAGLIKVALSLHHKVLPPTLKVERPNPSLGLEDGPLYINTQARPWIRGVDHPRRASVSSFGFGGSNFHVALEEYSGPGRRPSKLRAWSEELVLASAASHETLRSELATLAERIDAGHSLALIAQESAASFDHTAAARVALVVASVQELSDKLARARQALVDASAGDLADADISFGFGAPGLGRLAFVFPGQGSQYVGMGVAAAMTFDSVREIWDRAAGMPEFADDRLDRAVFPPPAFTGEERSRQSQSVTAMTTAQPAIAAVSLGYLDLLRRVGVEPDVVAGHSFGELTALAAGGRIDASELLVAARRRGELMAEASAARAGAMIAVSSNAETVARLIDGEHGIVIANDNAPSEVVLAGEVEAIEAASAKLQAEKLAAIRLPVATAFHSSIVADSCEPFHEYLASLEWRGGNAEVYANATADVYPESARAARRLLADQLASPVRFREMIEAMYSAGVTHFVEVGPGRVLTKLVDRCLGERPHLAVSLDAKGATGLRALWRGLGRLAADGVSLDLNALSEGYRVPDAPSEAKPFEIMITGFNYDRPYPPKGGTAGLPAPNPEPVERDVAPPPTVNGPPPPASSTLREVQDGGAVGGGTRGPAQVPASFVAASMPVAEAGALAEVQRATIEAHRRYQELMAESHRAFLDMAGQAMAQLGGAPSVDSTGARAIDPKAVQPAPESSTHVADGVYGGSAPTQGMQAPPDPGPAPEPVVPAAASRPESPPAPATSGSELEPDAPTPIDTTALALEVVSEKTGYPVEMLDLDMEMEAGLGIDSIKQVEILAELQERIPGLPEIAPSELAELRTLADVANKLRPAGAWESSPADAPSAATAVGAAAPASAAGRDTTALALEVVAEKTGYPVEMLDLDMEMEAGLGIDSIKQVEILAELQERIPGLEEITPAELAELRTLRDVANKLRPAGDQAVDEREEIVPEPMPAGSATVREEPAARTPIPSIVEASDSTPVAAFRPRLVPELRPGFGLAALSRGATIQITDELPELAEGLARGLGERGISAEVVKEVTPTAAVISLAGLVGGVIGPETSLAVHSSAMKAARIVAQHPDPSDRLFVTLQSTGGDFGLEGDPGPSAWLAGLPGIVKTAAREWPGASLKAIDVEDPRSAVEEILDELLYGGPALEVGISAAGARGVVRIEPLKGGGPSSPALEAGSVVVVSGGARGVTAASVARLAEEWNLRLALLGRSQLGEWPEGVPLSTDPVKLTGALARAAESRGKVVDLGAIQRQARGLAAGAEVRMSLAELDARGIETLYLSADVTDRAQVALALDHVRETWGPVSGIVHGAGILRDKAIADMTPDRVAEVFAPKVTGLAVLLEATRNDPIEVIALFSSIAARAGNAGQGAYAAANEVLNKVAAAEAARRGDGCRVRSYNWGPWAGGMVDGALAAHFEKQGIALLSIDSGTEFFVDELALAGDGVERVILASPSFPWHTHRLTFSGSSGVEGSGSGWMGTRVAPALVADLALRLGHALKPVLTMRTYLEDFVISKLSPGEESAGGVDVVDIVPVESDGPGYRMVFRDANGAARHETLVRYSETGAAPPPSVPSGGLEPWPIEARETVLSGEAEFRTIEELEGVSEEGGMALLRSAKGLGWPPKGFAWGFDPSALDGLLQLAELWTHHKAGAAQTLARMGSMVVHHLEAIPERLRSAFRARRTDTGTLFDFILATEEGDVVAELREVEFDAQSA